MNKKEFKDLLNRYENGETSDYENNLIEYWMIKDGDDNQINWISDLEKNYIKHQMKTQIDNQLFLNQPKNNYYRLKYILIAATLFIVFGLGVRLYITNSNVTTLQNNIQYAVSPGVKAGQLILTNGKVITLDNVKAGEIYNENGVTINKLENGKILYSIDQSQNSSQAEELVNTIRVPRGGMYDIILSDGTNVTLNSESSLTYPINFIGKNREVTLTGEAYFHVTQNLEKPFIVHTDFNDVLVTGTIFNVSAYPNDNNSITTLIEGGVNIYSNSSIIQLKPGQQAITNKDSNKYLVKNVDSYQSISWKDGYFLLDNQDLETIMKHVSRWYNVDLEYLVKPSNQNFGGTFSKNKSLEELLNHFEKLSGYKFHINERRVIVTK